MASPRFESGDEFREVIDQVFGMMSDDPEMGPALRDPRTSRPDRRVLIDSSGREE